MLKMLSLFSFMRVLHFAASSCNSASVRFLRKFWNQKFRVFGIFFEASQKLLSRWCGKMLNMQKAKQRKHLIGSTCNRVEN